jgi:O-acetyl-ADP-ribose deacetylase (regulator of RNase III)
MRVARIELWNGDICNLEVDAIVSPASTSLWMSTGVAGELKRTGGDAIEFAALRLGPARLGDAVVTPAGRLAARVVIHAVSLERDRRTSGPAIDRAARSAMARARELGLTSIAFPALGTGVGGFPLDEAAAIAVEAVRDELAVPSSIEHVIFALRGAVAYEAFARALSAGDPPPTRSLLTPVPWQSVGPGHLTSRGHASPVAVRRTPRREGSA